MHWLSRSSARLASIETGYCQGDAAIGATRMGELPVKLRDRAIFPREAGLLGNAVLCHYVVTIDGIGNRLLIASAP